MQHCYDHPLVGHLEITNTSTMVMKDFWWPTVKQFITAYVCGCAVCQSTKPNNTCLKPPLIPITSTRTQVSFKIISLNLIMDLSKLQKCDSILTIVNHSYSKAAIFLPCQKDINATEVATLYATQIFPFYRALKWIILDQDLCFTAHFT